MNTNHNHCAFVFGATGFIGSHLINRLSKEKVRTFAITRKNKKFVIPDKINNISWIHWDDVVDTIKKNTNESLNNLTIFHLASKISVSDSLHDPNKFIKENLLITSYISDMMTHLNHEPKVIYLSSDRVFGHAFGEIDENVSPKPIDPYGLSKFFGEELLRLYSLQNSQRVPIIRASNIFGDFQESNQFIPSLFKRFWKGEKTIKVGNLNVKRNFLYIDDLVSGLVSTLYYKQKKNLEYFHFAGENCTLSEIVSLFSDYARHNFGIDIEFIENKTLVRKNVNELGDFFLSTKKVKKQFDWECNISMKNGIEKIFKKEKNYFAKIR